MTAATDHPDDETLRDLSVGRLAEAEIARLSVHLGGCPPCCQRIDQLTTDDRLVTRLQANAGGREGLVNATERRCAVSALRFSKGIEAGQTRPAVPDAVPLPQAIGNYDILLEVGRGGMGVVYQARHRELRRISALKMVLAGEFASRIEGVRFQLEAELAARVKHPNIVQVYEIGDHAGRPYLVLEWVEGGSLQDKLTGLPWPPDEAAVLIETLARAIHTAHSEGVVHRDLKPPNILMTTDGTPKVTDFGLAQPLEQGEYLTRTGVLAGTPAYMAPEQAAGDRALIGPATDIYALGVILHQLTTGRLPFESTNTLELLRAITTDEPTRPRSLRPALPRDLEAVTLYCLEKEPGRRYASALALAEDLRRFRERKPVTARPAGSVARLARSCRRRPEVASLLSLLGICVIAGLGGVTWKWQEADGQRELVAAHARQSEDRTKEAEYQSYRASLAAATAAIENNDVAAASRYLQAAPEPLRGWEWRHLVSRLDESMEATPVPERSNGVLIPSADRVRIGLWSDVGLRLTAPDGGAPAVVPIAMSHIWGSPAFQTTRGLRVVAPDRDGRTIVFDDAGRRLCRMATELQEAQAVAMSQDGTRVACSWPENDYRLDIFDATTGRSVAVCRGATNTTWALVFSPDGSRLVSGGEDRTVRVWNAETGEAMATGCGHTSKIVSAAFHPDGTRLVTSSGDATVRQWDTRSGHELGAPYERHTAEVFTAVYSPDGECVASAGADRTIRVWRAKDRADIAVLHGHQGRIAQVAFAQDGRRLVSLSRRGLWVNKGDDTVRVWNTDPRTTLPELRGHTRGVQPLAYSRDGLRLATGSFDKTARVWDAATGEPVAVLPHPAAVTDLAFGPDGTWLATVNPLDSKLRIWDTATGLVNKEISLAFTNLQSLTVSADGTKAAVSGTDPETRSKRLCVVELGSGKVQFSTEGSASAYSADGRWLAGVSADSKTVLLLNASTHDTVARFESPGSTVFKVAFATDSRSLATCNTDATVRLWPVDGGECRVLRGVTDNVSALAFHPDGTRLATGVVDGTVWLWDLSRGEELVRLPGQTGFIWSLGFSPDGATLASCSADSRIRLWDTSPLKARFRARHEAITLPTE